MRLNRTLVAVALSVSPLLACSEEVGPCDNLADGEDTVLVGGQVQFGGQAIMNVACASCHSSTASGAARRGAPAGLDFDLLPVDPDDPALSDGPITNDKGQTIIKLKPAAVAGLRARQRRVFEDRNTIWQQVKDGMMPPQGAEFDGFRTLTNIIGTANDAPCQADVGGFQPLSRKSSRDVLRKWLACRAPVVEVNSSALVAAVPQLENNIIVSDAGSSGDAGTSSVQAAGSVGYQYPVCEDTGSNGTDITFEQVYAKAFVTCAGCHPSLSPPDLSSADAAYTAMVGKKSSTSECSGKGYVVAGSPDQSLLYELVSTDSPSCSERMPMGSMLSPSDQKLISDWIAGGALRASDLDKRRAPDALQSLPMQSFLRSRAEEPRASTAIDAGVDDDGED